MSRHGSVEAEVVEKDPRRVSRRKFLGAAAATGAAIAVRPGTVSAGEAYENKGRGGLDWTSDYAQNTYITVWTLTKERHLFEWGTDDALVLYENDTGERYELPGHVDRNDPEHVLPLLF